MSVFVMHKVLLYVHFIDQENNANFTLIIGADLSKFNEFVVNFSRKSGVDLSVVGVVT